jgi:transglutaminase-like putative cysteine protease
MKTAAVFLAFTFCSSLFSMLSADEPVFDSIDYASPSKYLVIADSLGGHDAIAKQAAALKGADDRNTLANVLRWMDTHLKYDDDRAYEWRDFDAVVSQRCYGGCADQAIVCGALLKSAGIPTVWVKTMDVNWMRCSSNDT